MIDKAKAPGGSRRIECSVTSPRRAASHHRPAFGSVNRGSGQWAVMVTSVSSWVGRQNCHGALPGTSS